MRVLCFLTLVASFFAADLALADFGPPYRVKVSVTADGSLNSSISSYISRELRSLGDVVIVSDSADDWHYQMSIVAIRRQYVSGGRAPQISISTVFSARVRTDILRQAVNEPYEKEAIGIFADGSEYIFAQLLDVTDIDALRETCNKLVAQFDVEVLEAARRAASDP